MKEILASLRALIEEERLKAAHESGVSRVQYLTAPQRENIKASSLARYEFSDRLEAIANEMDKALHSVGS